MALSIESLLPLWGRPLAGPTYTSGPFSGLRPVTIITGASDGIGFAFAHRFAALGHNLLLIARNAAALEATADAIRSHYRVEVWSLVLDITREDAETALDAKLSDIRGYANILVNNAGIGLSGDFTKQTAVGIDGLIALNVRALTLLMHHVLPGMQQRRCGGVINLASLGGYVPGPWQAAYYASKAYVLSLSEAVAAEVARDGVRVTAVAPGPVKTGFHERMQAEGALYRRWIPPLRPDTVAACGCIGFRLGARVIVPGLTNMFISLCLRVLPHRLGVVIVSWLLWPGKRETRNA